MRILLLGLLFLLCCCQSLAQTPECSASKLCEKGCCSSAGHCGYGPDFCGKGCLSSCERKSDCNPGWDSKEWSKGEKCPLNVCCSDFGFCGTTKEFCGNTDEVKRPSCSVSSTPMKRVIGYYEAWSKTERSCYNMLPEEIPYGYYTHINFAFGTIDPSTFELLPGDEKTEDYMRRMQSIKQIQPDVQVWLAVGGWTFNDPGPTATTFSDIAASTEAQDAFISSLIKMMNTYGFDGLDLDWEYPGAEDRNGREGDFENFVSFMDRLRKRLNDKGLKKKGLSLTLPSSYWYLQHFDIKNLEKSVDWFNIMSYDIHGSWDIENEHTGPWVNSHTNLTEIQSALDLLWRNDINPDKVVMGMSFYSRSFTLADKGCSEPGCIVASGGTPGKCSANTGVLLHPEIQDIIKENKLSPKMYREAAYKAVSWGNQWVSFDDVATWRLKSNAFRGQCISGIMVWAISQDDKDSTNLKALASAVGRKVMDAPDFGEKPVQALPMVEESPKSCTWAACGQECPTGFKLIWRESHKEQIFGADCQVGGMTKWCCPADQDLPVCEWRGHRNTGSCKAGCKTGEVEVGGINVGCKSGYQSACCTMTDATKAWSNCAWTTGKCDMNEKQACPSESPHRVAGAAWAWGNVPPCGWGKAERSYCCTEPPPEDFKKCNWITDVEDRKGKYCDACRDDQVRVAARSTTTCLTPSEALCCDRPSLDKRDSNDEPAYDPFGSKEAEQLRKLIKGYTDNPTCPATVLEPPIHDIYQKRSLDDEAFEDGKLRERATSCFKSDWDALLTYGTNMISRRTSYMDDLVNIWDENLAGPLDEQYEIASFRNYTDTFPDFDPRAIVERALYNPTLGGTHMRRAREFPSAFCGIDYADPQATKRELSDADLLENRSVWAYGGRASGLSPNDVPNLADVLLGILNGELSLHYARWIWFNAANSNAAPGPLLELAYWIGSEPGITPSNPQLFDAFRDRRAGRNGDRWVVFHLHFDPNRSFLHQFNEHTYMGASHVNIFHGSQYVTFPDHRDWRVNGRDVGAGANGANNNANTHQNTRDTLACSVYGYRQRLWYIGRVLPIPVDRNGNEWQGDDRHWFNMVQQWGQMLYRDGYVGEAAWRLIYPRAEVIEGTDRVDPGVRRPNNARSDELANTSGRGWVFENNWLIDPETGQVYRSGLGPP